MKLKISLRKKVNDKRNRQRFNIVLYDFSVIFNWQFIEYFL